MTRRDFCYWLKGLLELGDPSVEQIELIKRHLAMVLEKEKTLSAAHIQTLRAIHAG